MSVWGRGSSWFADHGNETSDLWEKALISRGVYSKAFVKVSVGVVVKNLPHRRHMGNGFDPLKRNGKLHLLFLPGKFKDRAASVMSHGRRVRHD